MSDPLPRINHQVGIIHSNGQYQKRSYTKNRSKSESTPKHKSHCCSTGHKRADTGHYGQNNLKIRNVIYDRVVLLVITVKTHLWSNYLSDVESGQGHGNDGESGHDQKADHQEGDQGQPRSNHFSREITLGHGQNVHIFTFITKNKKF